MLFDLNLKLPAVIIQGTPKPLETRHWFISKARLTDRQENIQTPIHRGAGNLTPSDPCYNIILIYIAMGHYTPPPDYPSKATVTQTVYCWTKRAT